MCKNIQSSWPCPTMSNKPELQLKRWVHLQEDSTWYSNIDHFFTLILLQGLRRRADSWNHSYAWKDEVDRRWHCGLEASESLAGGYRAGYHLGAFERFRSQLRFSWVTWGLWWGDQDLSKQVWWSKSVTPWVWSWNRSPNCLPGGRSASIWRCFLSLLAKYVEDLANHCNLGLAQPWCLNHWENSSNGRTTLHQ